MSSERDDRADEPARTSFRAALVEHDWVLPSRVPGVSGTTERFERVASAIARLADTLCGDESPVRLSFPPVIDRSVLRATGYMEYFPQLSGSIHSFAGGDRKLSDLLAVVERDGDWGPHLDQTDVMLCPAACYPLYPALSGKEFAEGTTHQVTGYVFRHEPSADPARLQAFRMHEHVRVDVPSEIGPWRKRWLARSLEMLESLGLDVRSELATDFFFGHRGRMMESSQRELELKHEIVCPIADAEPTAIASFNEHADHYGSTFGIRAGPAGRRETAHTACVGFGLERITLALIARHGFASTSWPADVARRLRL